MVRKTAYLFAFFILTGCGGIVPPRAPARQDAFAGINITKAQSAYPEMNVALILSENTKNSVTYGRAGSRMAGFDLAPLVEESFAFFKTNFKSVSRVEQVEQAAAEGADLVVLVDNYAVAKRSFKMEGKVVFMDLDGKEIDRVQAHSEKKFGFSPMAVVAGVISEVSGVLERGTRDSRKLAVYAESLGKGRARTDRRATVSTDILHPTYKGRPANDDYAVVVGIEDYSLIPDARFAQRDARAVAEHIEALGVPRRNIIHLAGDQATLTGLKKYLQAWLPRHVGPSSRVYFFFSGHGAPDIDTGNAYLVPWDGDPGFITETGYPLNHLYRDLSKLPSKQIIVALDTCFSGAGGRSALAKGARPLVTKVNLGSSPTESITLFTAAESNQITTTVEDKGHGIFTYFFLKGLNGAAKDARGQVTANSLFRYLKPEVQDEARRQNREQTPTARYKADVVIR